MGNNLWPTLVHFYNTTHTYACIDSTETTRYDTIELTGGG